MALSAAPVAEPEAPDASTAGPSPQRRQIIAAALKAHPELGQDPHKLAFVVGGVERGLGTPAALPQPAPADATAIPQTPKQAQQGVADGIAHMIGDAGNALKFLFTGGRQPGQTPEIPVARAPQWAERPAPTLTPEQQASIQRGSAILASLAVTGPVTDIAAPLAGRVGSALIGDAAAGTAYGLIRPLDPGEERAQAVLKDAGSFALAGQALRVVGGGIG